MLFSTGFEFVGDISSTEYYYKKNCFMELYRQQFLSLYVEFSLNNFTYIVLSDRNRS